MGNAVESSSVDLSQDDRRIHREFSHLHELPELLIHGFEVCGEVAEEGLFVRESHASDGLALTVDLKNYFN